MSRGKSRSKERKPLSFSTTMRNPERIHGFLSVIQEYDGKELTSEIIDQIVNKVLKRKIYVTQYQARSEKLKKILSDDGATYSDEQIEDIKKNAPQQHKEAGFSAGWESRFDTWYKLIKELGFVYYKYGEAIQISEIGNLLCETYKERNDAIFNEKIQAVFLNVLCKYHTSNPFRRNANKNVPLILLTKLLDLMKKEDPKSTGISKKEIPFLLCWRNDDHKALYHFIKNFRQKYGFKASEEKIYRYCLRFLESTNTTRFKISQILVEGVDDFIRKMRITGLFSLRGMGRFLDLNSFQNEKIEYIIKHYSNQPEYIDEKEYFAHIGTIDNNLLTLKEKNHDKDVENIKNQALEKFSKQYKFETICEELMKLRTKKDLSNDDLMKSIERPTRFEFLTSIALKQCFPHAVIHPNYATDDEGVPTFTARGGVADIELEDKNNEVLVEVTLLNGVAQGKGEIPAITRHLLDLESKSNEKRNRFSIFIAPDVHWDTQFMCEFSLQRHNVRISPLSIANFIQKLKNQETIEDFGI